MGQTTVDWRWIVVIVVALFFFGQLRLGSSSELGMVLLALGGYWAVLAGLRPWREQGSILGNRKVTYWRGQRIELERPRRSRFRTPVTTSLLVSFVYLAMGAGLWLGALRILLRLITSWR